MKFQKTAVAFTLALMTLGLTACASNFNADVSRQRAEAVRMAQEKMENLRAFGVLSGAAVPGDQEYIDIVAGTDYPAPPSGFANTAFTRFGHRTGFNKAGFPSARE